MRRRIGLAGGVSHESTVEHDRYIMRTYVETIGDMYLPEVIINGVQAQQLFDWSDSGRRDRTAEGIILWCTEIPLMIDSTG